MSNWKKHYANKLGIYVRNGDLRLTTIGMIYGNKLNNKPA
jgi:hypothetical protein